MENKLNSNFTINKCTRDASAMDASPREIEQRQMQTCSLCRIHDLKQPKRGHKCPYDNEEHYKNCEDCSIIKRRRLFNANYNKQKRKTEEGNRNSSLNGRRDRSGRIRGEQYCRKCRNHGETNTLKQHKSKCIYEKCKCPLCKYTAQGRQDGAKEARTCRQKIKINKYNEYASSQLSPMSQYDSSYYSASPADSFSSEYSTQNNFDYSEIDMKPNNVEMLESVFNDPQPTYALTTNEPNTYMFDEFWSKSFDYSLDSIKIDDLLYFDHDILNNINDLI